MSEHLCTHQDISNRMAQSILVKLKWRNFPGGLVAKTALLMLMTRAQFLVGELDPTFYN